MKSSGDAVRKAFDWMKDRRMSDFNKERELESQITKLQGELATLKRKQKLQNQIIALVFAKKREPQELIERFSDWASEEEVNNTIRELVDGGVLESGNDGQLGFTHRFWFYPNDAVYH